LIQKLQFTNVHCPSYRKSLQSSIENSQQLQNMKFLNFFFFFGNFCLPVSESKSAFQMEILIRIQKTKINWDPCRSGSESSTYCELTRTTLCECSDSWMTHISSPPNITQQANTVVREKQPIPDSGKTPLPPPPGATVDLLLAWLTQRETPKRGPNTLYTNARKITN
jgi:hypothetical protein